MFDDFICISSLVMGFNIFVLWLADLIAYFNTTMFDGVWRASKQAK